jgi:hypothetical protein
MEERAGTTRERALRTQVRLETAIREADAFQTDRVGDKRTMAPVRVGSRRFLVLAGAIGGPVVRLRPSYPRRSCGEPESRWCGCARDIGVWRRRWCR